MPTTIYDFINNDDWESNVSIEMSTGARLVNQFSAFAYAIPYTSDINATVGTVKTGTATGGAAVSGGELDLSFSDSRFVNYDIAADITDNNNVSYRFKFRPNWSSNPGALIPLFSAKQNDSNTNNAVGLDVAANGDIRIYLRDAIGTNILNNVIVGNWLVTLNQQYEFLLVVDTNNGLTKLYIDGVQLGITYTNVITRDEENLELVIGNSNTESLNSNGKYADVALYNGSIFTTNYTPGYAIPTTTYTITNPNVCWLQALEADSVTSIALVGAVAGNDSITFNMKNNGVRQYIVAGSLVTVPDNDDIQYTNTITEWNTFFQTFEPVGDFEFNMCMYLHSDDGGTTPEAVQLTVVWIPRPIDPDGIHLTRVEMYSFNDDGTINLTPPTAFMGIPLTKYKTNITMYRKTVTGSDVDPVTGFCHIDVADSDNMTNPLTPWIFTLAEREYAGVVNELESQALTDIIGL